METGGGGWEGGGGGNMICFSGLFFEGGVSFVHTLTAYYGPNNCMHDSSKWVM